MSHHSGFVSNHFDAFVGIELERRRPMNKLQFGSRDIAEPTWRRPFVLPVERVTDFDNNEDRQRHRLRMRIVEDLTVETREHARLGRTLHVMSLTDPTNHLTYRYQWHR